MTEKPSKKYLHYTLLVKVVFPDDELNGIGALTDEIECSACNSQIEVKDVRISTTKNIKKD